MAAIDTGRGRPRLSQIVLDNAGIAGPRRHPLRLTGIPRQGRHPAGMRGIAHGRIRGMQRRRNGLNFLQGMAIVQVHLSEIGPDGNAMGVRGGGTPADRRDIIIGMIDRDQMLNVARRGIPQIHGLGQGHGQDIVLRPTNQVQIIIIDNVGGIQNAQGRRRNLAPHTLAAAVGATRHPLATHVVVDPGIVIGPSLNCGDGASQFELPQGIVAKGIDEGRRWESHVLAPTGGRPHTICTQRALSSSMSLARPNGQQSNGMSGLGQLMEGNIAQGTEQASFVFLLQGGFLRNRWGWWWLRGRRRRLCGVRVVLVCRRGQEGPSTQFHIQASPRGNKAIVRFDASGRVQGGQ